jgi:RHS repeat-associated protein
MIRKRLTKKLRGSATPTLESTAAFGTTVQFSNIASAQQSGSGGIQFWGADADGQIWNIYQQSPGGSWSSWQGPGFQNQPVPASKLTGADQNTGCLMFFMLDLSGKVWAIPQLSPSGGWGSWSGPGLANQPVPFYEISAAQQSGNRGVSLKAIDANGAIWVLYQTTPGGAWSKWEGPGFKNQPEPMTLVTQAGQNNGDLELFSTNKSYSVWAIPQLSPGGDYGAWTGPGIANQPLPYYQISAAQQSGNRGVSLKTIDSNGALWVLYQTTPGGAWSNWEGPGFYSQPTAMKLLTQAGQNNGCLQLFTIDLSNNLWTISQLSPGGNYGAWSQMALPKSSILPQPGAIFPIPNLYGDTNEYGVNLFTGDVNFSLGLATISDGKLEYPLNIFYNSKGAAYDEAAPDNSLFSASWKLMDYPKVVNSDEGLYFLDGYAAYLLSTTDNANYATNGIYNPWRFYFADNQWQITTDEGLRYVLAGTYTLETGDQAWTLTSFTDLSWPTCALQFTYSGGNITGITNSLGDQITVSYSAEGQLIGATTQTVINDVTTPISLTNLAYTNGNLSSLTVGKPTLAGLNNALPPYIFSYSNPVEGYSSGYTNILTSVQNPDGGTMLYTYYAQPAAGTAGSPYPVGSFPVVGVQSNTQTGQGKSALLSYAGYVMDPTDVYTQWNNANLYPGAVSNVDTAVTTTANVLALFGSKSYYFFNGNVNNYTGDASVATNPVALGTSYQDQSYIPLVEQTWDKVEESSSTILNITVNPPAYGLCKFFTINTNFAGGYVGQPISVNAFDADNDLVASTTTIAASGTNTIGVILQVPAVIATINISSDFISGSGTATVGPFTFFLEVDETVDNTSKIDLFLSMQDVRQYSIGTNQANQSFLKLVTSNKTIGGTTTVTTTQYGDDTTLPYPISISETIGIPQPDGSSIATTLSKEFVYAVQQYTDLDHINLRKPIAQFQNWASSVPINGTTGTGFTTIQWQQFTTALGQYAGWGPWRKYVLYQNNFTDGFAAEPDEHWLLVNTIVQRNNRGVAISSLDVNDVMASQLLSTNGAVPVASFQNADVTASQAGWTSFEFYEDMSNWSYSSGAQIITGQGYTGQYCLTGSDYQLNAVTFNPTADTAYVAGCYVLLQAGASCELAFYDNSTGTVGATASMAYDATDTGWRYIQCVMTAPTSSYLPSLKLLGTGMVNNIFFAPVTGLFNAAVWNLYQQQTIASLGFNGDVTQKVYDAMGNGIALATPGRNLSLVQNGFSSVLGQYWLNGTYTFSAGAPNQSLNLRTPKQGQWDDFCSQTTTLFPADNLTNMVMTSNHLLAGTASTSAASPSYATCTASPSQSDFVVSTELMFSTSTAATSTLLGATVSYTTPDAAGDTQVFFGFNGQALVLMALPSNTVLTSIAFKNIPAAVTLTLLVRNGNQLYGYGGGNLMLQYDLTTTVGGTIGLFSTWSGAGFYNFGLISAPELANATRDGLNNKVQFLSSIDGSNANVSQSLRTGNLNRFAAATLPTSLTAPGLAPISDFAELTPSSDTLQVTESSSINAYWSAEYNQAPFSSSVLFYNAPLALPGSRGKGGQFTAGTSGSISYYYGQQGDMYFNLSSTDYLVSMSQSATGAQVTTLAGPTGLIAGKIRVDDANDQKLVTNFCYDYFLNRTGTFYPASWTSGVNTQTFYSNSVYSFIGLVGESGSTDGGTINYRYNNAALLRLLQTSAGTYAETPYCVYSQYDILGRLLHQGTWNGSYGDVSSDELNDLQWPYDGQPQNSFTWDWDGDADSANPSMGRILQATAVLPNAAGNWQQNFTYDAAGNIVNTQTNIVADDATPVANLTQAFDGLNRLTGISDTVSGYDVVYAYDELGRMVSVGTSEAPTCFATYSYANGSVVETLLSGKITRTYTMNALGQIESIVDAYFQETLYYGVRQNGEPGYLNGQIASAQCSFATACVDQAGNPIGTFTEEYVYDNFGRLQSSTNSLGDAYSFAVTYDANGNILTLNYGTAGTTTYAYNAGTNQLASSTDGESYDYDASGNTITVNGINNLSLSYDAVSGQPSSMGDGTTTVTFGYDAFGQRVARVVTATDGATTLYVRDSNGRVMVETDGKNPTALYIYGLMGRIAMLPQDGSGNLSNDVYLLLNDHLGSPRIVVSNDGSPVAWYNFDPYGEMVEYLSNEGKINLHYLFTGQELDTAFKVYDFQARLYDPTTCRFYSPDPLHQFASPYIYTNNPISFEDPTGEWFGWDDAIAIAGGALIGGGLELLREVAAGEDVSWRNIAVGAAVGAAAGELALYTGGAGITGYGAVQTLVTGAVTGAAIGAGTGLVTGGVTALVTGDSSQISKQALNGAITGAQAGLLSGFFAQAAKSISPIYRTGTTTTIGIVDSPLFGNRASYTFAEYTPLSMAVGAASGAANAIIQGFVHNDSWSTITKNAMLGAVTGALTRGTPNAQVRYQDGFLPMHVQ